jgi:hypothetical protein
MPRDCYTVQRLDGEWVVLASDSKILICQDESTAIEAAKNAAELLHQGGRRDRRTDALWSRAGEVPGGGGLRATNVIPTG